MNDTHGVSGEGWYGFDLDGTLAKYDGWKGLDNIGEPIKPMVDLVKQMHAEGKVVKILTARVAPRLCGETHATGCKCGHCEEEASKPPVMQEQYLVKLGKDGRTIKLRASDYIRDWCVKHLGFAPEIVYQKDHLMLELYDDRVKQVVPNKGWLVEDIAASKRQRVVIDRVEVVDVKWWSRLNWFCLGAVLTMILVVVLQAIFVQVKPLPEATENLDKAIHEFMESQRWEAHE